MGKSDVILRHMTYSGEGEEEREGRVGEDQEITFLYKIAAGADPNRCTKRKMTLFFEQYFF
jgi:hypothetical protein